MENSAAWLSDEVIHVVSGFQVAGFPHVVACRGFGMRRGGDTGETILLVGITVGRGKR